MSGHTPLQVTAHLESGFVTTSPWGIALDGLLAAQIWPTQKSQHTLPGGLHAQTNPPDLDLPLATCHSAGDDLWHWCATCAFPTGPGTPHTEVRYWTARINTRQAEQLAHTLPTRISTRQGPYRPYLMPSLATVCSAVSWYAIGDPEHITTLLWQVAAIGKRRGTGEGRVLHWQIEPVADLDTFTAAHLHPDRTLGRPTPTGCLAETAVTGSGSGVAGLRPPYMHRSRQHDLLLPAFLGGDPR